MPITDPTAVAFSNQKIRQAADRLAKTYNFIQSINDEWFALGMGTLITNDSEVIVDGAATDGRPVITGADANNVMTRIGEFLADYDATNKAKLNTILKVAVNTRP